MRHLGELVRLAVSWGAVVLALLAGSHIEALSTASLLGAAAVFAVMLGVIMWAAFGVVERADVLAERLGEPFGTLLLTLSIVVIEVALIGAVMIGASDPTLGRDAMFAVVMIVLNGVTGLGLLIGGWRHGSQAYNLEGASAFLVLIVPLSVIALVLPDFTTSTDGGTLSLGQSIAFSCFTLVLYGVFLLLQTGRLRDYFVMPENASHAGADEEHAEEGEGFFGSLTGQVVRLLAALLPVVLLAKQLAKVLDHFIAEVHAPKALGGVVIAMIVFTPEGIAAIRAVSLNRLQRTINLCLGAVASTIGLTVPVLLLISIATGQQVVLGLPATQVVLLTLTLLLANLTFSGRRTTALNGAMHLGVFFIYLTLIFSP